MMFCGVLLAVEWLGHKHVSRTVLITLDEARQRIVIAEDKKVMRTIDLSKLERTDNERVTVMLSADVEMKTLLIRVPKEYDLVCPI